MTTNVENPATNNDHVRLALQQALAVVDKDLAWRRDGLGCTPVVPMTDYQSGLYEAVRFAGYRVTLVDCLKSLDECPSGNSPTVPK